jgi:hypothetical protein
MNFLPAASFGNRLAFQLSAHDVYSFANGIKKAVALYLQGGTKSALWDFLFMGGHRADRKPAVNSRQWKPQLRGAFAFQAKNLT